MKKILKDSSEILEARELLLEIMREPTPAPGGGPRVLPPPLTRPAVAPVARSATVEDLVPPAVDVSVAEVTVVPATPAAAPATEPATEPAAEPSSATVAAPAAAQPTTASDAPASSVAVADDASRGDQLQNILTILCAREGLAGALVTDSGGLPLASSSNMEVSESLAAFSTVLGDALHKAGSYLGQDEASEVSLNINPMQKVVLHRFDLEGRPYYLLVLCDPEFDPRLAARGVVPEILSVLAVS